MQNLGRISCSFFVILANFWIWRIFNQDLVIGLSLVILSFLLFLLYFKFNKVFLILTLIITIFLSSRILNTGFDNNLINLNPDQEKQQNARHGYFSIELGKLFQNKLTLRFYKDFYPTLSNYGNNVFNILSPNLYFFENHPREREKVGEFPKYPGIFILPFIVGFLLLFKTTSKVLTAYFLFVLLVSGFIRQNYFLGPVLFYPLINLLITNGLIKIYKIFRK